MRRCLVPSKILDCEVCTLPVETSHHLTAVLRIACGEELCLLDGEGRRGVFEVENPLRKGVVCRRKSQLESFPSPVSPVTLFQSIAKGSRMDWLVEKATELGVARLVPVLSEHTVCRFKKNETVDRWQRIADSAIEQCDGVWRTIIAPVTSFESSLEQIRACNLKIAGALTNDAVPVANIISAASIGPIAVCIGPEGDFSPSEYNNLRAANVKMAGLGARVLRVETAAVYALSVISALRG